MSDFTCPVHGYDHCGCREQYDEDWDLEYEDEDDD